MTTYLYLSARLVLTLVVLAPSAVLGQNIHLVPAMFPTIQAAFDQSANGDIVEVAPGVYHEILNFPSRDVWVVSTGGPTVTIIDAQGMGTAVTLGQGVSLEGFTITGGVGQPSTSFPLHGRPGGVLIGANFNTSRPNLRRCIISGNVGAAGSDAVGSGAGQNGGAGGIDIAGAAGFIVDCTVTMNTGGMGGRGFAPAAHGTGGPGGVLAAGASQLERCRIIDNIGGNTNSSAATSGRGGAGGLAADTSTIPFSSGACNLYLCEVTGNTGGSGRDTEGVGGTGGIHVIGYSTLLNVLCAKNQGGSGDPMLVFPSRGGHGGIAIDSPNAPVISIPSSRLDLLQSTVADNVAGAGGQAFAIGGVVARASGRIQNSVVHGNLGAMPTQNDVFLISPIGVGPPVTPVSSSIGGTDPLFVSRTLGDYRLSATSPEIDASIPLETSIFWSHLAEVDLRCFSRAVGMAPDRGAFEWHPIEGPHLTGSCERIFLRSTTSTNPDGGVAVKDVFAGDQVNVSVILGFLNTNGISHFLLAQSYTAGLEPMNHRLYPELHCDSGAIILAAHLSQTVGLGLSVSGVLPPGLGGTILRLQAVIPQTQALNRVFMISDAHDLLLR